MKQTFTDLMSVTGQLGEFKHLLIGFVLMTALHQIAFILVSMMSVWITTRLVFEGHPQLFLPFLVLFSPAIVHVLYCLYSAWWSH